MKIWPSLYLGIRNFKTKGEVRKGHKLMGAVLGIAVSMLPLVVVMEVANGMIEGITRRFVEVGSAHLQVRNYRSRSEEHFQEILDLLSIQENIQLVQPMVLGNGLMYSPHGRAGINLRGVSPDYYSTDSGLREYLEIVDGEFALNELNSIILSAAIAKDLNVSVGGTVKLLTAVEMPGRGPMLKPTTFTIVGLVSSGYHDLDSITSYIHYDKARSLFRDPRDRHINLKVADPYDQSEFMAYDLRKVLPSGWSVRTWYDLSPDLYRSFETIRTMLLLIMALVVVVASVNIYSSIVMLVIEKQEDIAFLKSTGTSPGQIRLAFLFTGFCIGVIGAMIGLAVGLFLAVNINEVVAVLEWVINWGYSVIRTVLSPFSGLEDRRIELLDAQFYLEKIPIKIHFIDTAIIGGLAIFLSTVASFFPARKAGKIRPVDVLQKI